MSRPRVYPELIPGDRIGTRVVVRAYPAMGGKQRRLMVRCDCGNEKVVQETAFRRSLGCKTCGKRGEPTAFLRLTLGELAATFGVLGRADSPSIRSASAKVEQAIKRLAR